MMNVLRLLLIASFLLTPAAPVLAADGGETTVMQDGTTVVTQTGEPTGESGQCGFDKFIHDLAQRESSGNCTVVNQYGYMGKYQFGKAALTDIGYIRNGQWTGKNGIHSQQDFLNSCEAQDVAAREWMNHMAAEIRSYGLDKYVGQTIGGCEISWSGLLAGRHLKGIGNASKPGLKHFLESNGAIDGADGNGTRVSEYVCKFKGYETPYDAGKTYESCGGGMNYGGQPGSGKPPNEREYYGDRWSANPEVRHYALLSDAILRVWLGGLALMTNQMVNTMMMQAKIVGGFFDAKHQLETQRLLQQKTARAHKDYHPSEQMCAIGTFARNLMNTERRAEFSQLVLSERAMQRELLRGENLTIETAVSDRQSRFETFRTKFCNPADNVGTLAGICEKGIDPDMMNRDIDFTRTLDRPLTLQFDPLEPENGDEEAAVYALMDNLFQNKPLPSIRKEKTTLPEAQEVIMELRSIVALRATARNSMNHYIAQKSYGPEEKDAGSNAPYLRALIRDMGITSEEEITKLLGERPSYYAQMEVLTKKIYQHPEFIVNLYDKPANVERVSAAMQAIKTMQNRDIHEALQRREMLISIIAELSVRRQQQHIDSLVRSLRVQR